MVSHWRALGQAPDSSPAAQAKLRRGDVITSMDGKDSRTAAVVHRRGDGQLGSGATNCLVDAGAVILAVRATAVASPEEVLKALDSERQQKRPLVPVLIFGSQRVPLDAVSAELTEADKPNPALRSLRTA